MRLPAFLATSIAIAAFAMLLQPAEARCCRCNFGKVSVNASCHTVTGTACQAGTTACAPGEVTTPPTETGSGEKPVDTDSTGRVGTTQPAVEETQPAVEEQQPAVEETQPVVEEQQPVVEEQPAVEEKQPVVEEPEAPAEKPVGTTSEGAADEETNN